MDPNKFTNITIDGNLITTTYDGKTSANDIFDINTKTFDTALDKCTDLAYVGNDFYVAAHWIRAWKKTVYDCPHKANEEYVTELLIPPGAMIYIENICQYDCKKRASCAYVIGHEILCHACTEVTTGTTKITKSARFPHLKYKCGEFVRPHAPFAREDEQCASGIHLYFNKSTAKQHWF